MTDLFAHSSTPEPKRQTATPDGLKDVLEGRPLVRYPNVVRDEFCDRCDDKNTTRLRYELETRDPSFDDGERVTLICGYNADPEETDGWKIGAVYHSDHPTLSKSDVALFAQAQAEVTARLDREGWTYTFPPLRPGDDPQERHIDKRSVVRDVELEWFSPVDDGGERQPIREPAEHGAIELEPTDPRPDWPDEENEWRKEIMQEHDDFNDDVPVFENDEKV